MTLTGMIQKKAQNPAQTHNDWHHCFYTRRKQQYSCWLGLQKDTGLAATQPSSFKNRYAWQGVGEGTPLLLQMHQNGPRALSYQISWPVGHFLWGLVKWLCLLCLQLRFCVSELKMALVSRMTGGVFNVEPGWLLVPITAQREKQGLPSKGCHFIFYHIR
jgi:hypothetical protein